jgi:hypothetical protein
MNLLLGTLLLRFGTLGFAAWILLRSATPPLPRHLAATRLAQRATGELAPTDAAWGCATPEVTLTRRAAAASASARGAAPTALSASIRPSLEPRDPFAVFSRGWACAWDGAHFMYRARHGLAYGNAQRAVFTVTIAAPPAFGLDRDEETGRWWVVEGGGGRSTLAPPHAARDELMRINGVTPLPSPLRMPPLPFNLTFASSKTLLNEAAFAPLWPWLLWLARCAGAPGAAIALATLCSTLGVALAAQARRETLGVEPALPLHRLPLERSDLWLLVSPGALFFCAPYSECLFLPLAAGWLLALARRQHAVACALGVALPLARGLGAFFALPALVYAARATGVVGKGRAAGGGAATGAQGGGTRRVKGAAEGAVEPRLSLFAGAALCAAPALGYALHLAHLHGAMEGGWSAGLAAQRGFVAQFSASNLLKPWKLVRTVLGEGAELGPKVAVLVPAWRGFLGGLSWHDVPAFSLLDRLALGAVAALAAGAASAGKHAATGATRRRLPPYVWCVALVLALVPPLSGSMMSYVRFASIAGFPLAWSAADAAPRWALGAAAAAALALQADLVARFALGGWAG